MRIERLSMLPPQPFIGDITQGDGHPTAYPGHKVTVELESRPTLGQEKAPYILRIAVAGIDNGAAPDLSTVPVEVHISPVFHVSVYRQYTAEASSLFLTDCAPESS